MEWDIILIDGLTGSPRPGRVPLSLSIVHCPGYGMEVVREPEGQEDQGSFINAAKEFPSTNP